MTTTDLITLDYTQATLFPEDLPNHHGQLIAYIDAGLTRDVAATLEQRAARIISLGRKVILEIGVELLAARAEAQRGTWGAFLERVGLQERAAQNYMNAAEKFAAEPEMFSALPPSALYALAAPSADPVVAEQVIAEVKAGARPTVEEVKQRLAPKPAPAAAPSPAERRAPPPAPSPAATPAPAVMPPALVMTPVTPATAPAAGPDLPALKLLMAKHRLLLAALALVEADVRALPDDAPLVELDETAVQASARTFVGAPGLQMAAAGLAMGATVTIDA